MPLLLLDLDNTLLPRDAAFRAWAQEFLTERGLPPGDVDWLSTIDGGGYVPRSTVLSAARRRYGLDESLDRLLAHYRRGINSHIHCPSRNIDALRAARAAGWTLGIVSNGGTGPQLEKIRRTGLGPLVDGWVISEEADCLKPDPLIFEIAAQRCGIAPIGDWASHTWMIGDHAPADIAGAELAGLHSVWLHHGRPWAEPGYRPTLKAAGLPEAVGQVLSARVAPSPRPGIRAGGPLGRRAGDSEGVPRSRDRGIPGARALALAPTGTVTASVGAAVPIGTVTAAGIGITAGGTPAAGTVVTTGSVTATGVAVVPIGPRSPGPSIRAQTGVRSGAQFSPSALDDGHAPVAANATSCATPHPGAGSVVRNRPGGFAADSAEHSASAGSADVVEPPVGLPSTTGGPPARTRFAAPPARRVPRPGTAASPRTAGAPAAPAHRAARTG
ncbi:HAD-IA family hydrolase [Streptomyces sp. BE20]|uniref:HAD-IA family hydrolase n=1 Tax=Streptomyces sp. BE20 TaxID=3002525 RepID=UPI002E78DFA4|nr:HAD-IA family hydrolase [Streptomyces sp. BE20]MEE1827556.1 HAD-IA family hydrolase [Streptomyces sp. BE20]